MVCVAGLALLVLYMVLIGKNKSNSILGVSFSLTFAFFCFFFFFFLRSSQSILKEISPGCSLEGMMLKLKLQYFGHLMQRVGSDAGRDWGQEKGLRKKEKTQLADIMKSPYYWYDFQRHW